MNFLRLALKTLRLAILRISPGWMFGLLTFNFNRISIYELGAIGVIVATLIGFHHLLSPLQVAIGHFSDRHPLLGFRRSPYILLSGLLGALVFLALPWLSVALGKPQNTEALMAANPHFQFPESALMMQNHPVATLIIAFALIVLFGLAMAANGTSSAALIVETIEEKHRGPVFVIVWMTMVFSAIFSAGVTKAIMPVYDPAQMQFLYTLTLPIVLVTSLIGLVGMERRISREEHATVMAKQRVETASENAFGVFWQLIKSNQQVRQFFLFVLLAMFGIFLQDAILEVFGAEVFGMDPKDTAEFTQIWGTGILVGLFLIFAIARFQYVSKKTVAVVGGVGIALGLGVISMASLTYNASLVSPGLFLMGVSTGLFDFGAMSLMMDMTVEGYAGLYMGMWGLSQGLGQGLANSISGALHTGLIETQLMTPSAAYGAIYGGEAIVMILAIIVLRSINVQEFKGLSQSDIGAVVAFETAT